MPANCDQNGKLLPASPNLLHAFCFPLPVMAGLDSKTFKDRAKIGRPLRIAGRSRHSRKVWMAAAMRPAVVIQQRRPKAVASQAKAPGKRQIATKRAMVSLPSVRPPR